MVAGMFGASLVIAVFFVFLAPNMSRRYVTQIDQVPAMSITPADRRGPSAADIYEQDASAVVVVKATGASTPQSATEFENGELSSGNEVSASGFEAAGAGLIVTNWHVVANATRVDVQFSEGGRPVTAHVAMADPSHDLAVLRVSATRQRWHILMLGESRTIHVGAPVVAVGSPFGYFRTVTAGIVSAVHRRIKGPTGGMIDDALQTDAPINPGNSGGPLIDQRGRVIGIDSQIVAAGPRGGNVGIAFAIPVDVARQDLAAVLSREH